MDEHLIRAKVWRERAEEMRVVGETMRDQAARADLLKAASNWERMAAQAEARSVRKPPNGPPPAPAGTATTVTCKCGARYRRTMVKGADRETYTFECFVCQAPIESWDGFDYPQFELVGRPDREPGDGR